MGGSRVCWMVGDARKQEIVTNDTAKKCGVSFRIAIGLLRFTAARIMGEREGCNRGPSVGNRHEYSV